MSLAARFESRSRLGLYDTPPDRREIWLAVAVVGLLFTAFLLILPVHNVRLPEIDAFIPVIDAVIAVTELIIGAKIYVQAVVFRSRALTVLASCFVASAFLVVAHALTFPGAFSPNGLFGAKVNTTAWLGMFRMWAFPAAVIPYALLKSAEAAASSAERPPVRVVWAVAGALALAASAILLTTAGHDLLPPLFLDRREAFHPGLTVATGLAIALTLGAMFLLFQKRPSVLDTWLFVALVAWLIEQILNIFLHERFSLGWYSLNGLMLASNLIVMLALIAEGARTYVRLALTTAARDREVEVRLMSMEAVAAAIAHEIAQPLTAITLSAKAGLNSLMREPPDPEKALEALRDTINAGKRGFDVVKSIRADLAIGPGRRSQFSLNDLASETASLLDRELAARHVSLQFSLAEGLSPILADRVQIQRVLINLLTNAIDSLGATRRRARRIAIYTAQSDDQSVLLEISDSGDGIAPEKVEDIFKPFFTTKSTGTGLGLSLSRTIVEEHGGRLWASPNQERGATFHLQLPRSWEPELLQETSGADASMAQAARTRHWRPSFANLLRPESGVR